MLRQFTDFDLKLLRVFIAVAEAHGFAAAESELNITTSTISVHISNLEKRLGMRLCERGRSGFKLTAHGKTVYREVKALLQTLNDFSGNLASVRNHLAGHIVFGIVDSLVTHPQFQIHEVIREFNKLENDVNIELVVAPRQVLEHEVVEGGVHAAIGPFIRKISSLKFAPLFEEHHELYCGVGHPLFKAPKSDFSNIDLSTYSSVVRKYHQEFDRDRLGVNKERAIVNNMEGMLILLLSGEYIGFLPKHYACQWVDKNQLSPISGADTNYTSTHALITKLASSKSSALNAFISIIFEKSMC